MYPSLVASYNVISLDSILYSPTFDKEEWDQALLDTEKEMKQFGTMRSKCLDGATAERYVSENLGSDEKYIRK